MGGNSEKIMRKMEAPLAMEIRALVSPKIQLNSPRLGPPPSDELTPEIIVIKRLTAPGKATVAANRTAAQRNR